MVGHHPLSPKSFFSEKRVFVEDFTVLRRLSFFGYPLGVLWKRFFPFFLRVYEPVFAASYPAGSKTPFAAPLPVEI